MIFLDQMLDHRRALILQVAPNDLGYLTEYLKLLFRMYMGLCFPLPAVRQIPIPVTHVVPFCWLLLCFGLYRHRFFGGVQAQIFHSCHPAELPDTPFLDAAGVTCSGSVALALCLRFTAAWFVLCTGSITSIGRTIPP